MVGPLYTTNLPIQFFQIYYRTPHPFCFVFLSVSCSIYCCGTSPSPHLSPAALIGHFHTIYSPFRKCPHRPDAQPMHFSPTINILVNKLITHLNQSGFGTQWQSCIYKSAYFFIWFVSLSIKSGLSYPRVTRELKRVFVYRTCITASFCDEQ